MNVLGDAGSKATVSSEQQPKRIVIEHPETIQESIEPFGIHVEVLDVERASDLMPRLLRDLGGGSFCPQQILNSIPVLRRGRVEFENALGHERKPHIRQRLKTGAHPFALAALGRENWEAQSVADGRERAVCVR